MIGPKGVKFLHFDGGHPGVVKSKFGKDWRKEKPSLWGFFPLKFPGLCHNSVPL